MTTASLVGVSQGYGKQCVLSGLDLDVGSGVLGLLGPNGAGKSTLIRTLATIMPPRAGTVSICGEKVHSEPTARRARRNIGYLPQDFGYYPGFSVVDFVCYCAWLRGVPTHRAQEATMRAIAAVGLSEQRKKRMGALSGGMLRRAGIASAIVGTPRIILLDEPTVGLDPAQRLDFRALVRASSDAAVVLSTHLVEDVAAVCDRVAVMRDGQLVFHGTPEALAAAAADDTPGDTPLERGYMTVLGNYVGA